MEGLEGGVGNMEKTRHLKSRKKLEDFFQARIEFSISVIGKYAHVIHIFALHTDNRRFYVHIHTHTHSHKNVDFVVAAHLFYMNWLLLFP